MTRDTYGCLFEQGKGYQIFFSIGLPSWKFFFYELIPFSRGVLSVTCHKNEVKEPFAARWRSPVKMEGSQTCWTRSASATPRRVWARSPKQRNAVQNAASGRAVTWGGGRGEAL